MATIKSYTDLSQSKTLSKILPLESADMYWWSSGKRYYIEAMDDGDFNEKEGHIRAWSLAALLDVMPKDKSVECSVSFGYYNGKGKYIEKWLCAFEKEGETTDDYIIETFDGDNSIDACVAMVERLHELNLL